MKLLALALLLGVPGCAMTVTLPGETGTDTVAPRVLVSSEVAEAALEAGRNWTDATQNLNRAYAPLFEVADDVSPDAETADWTVVMVDHVDACVTENDPDPRGCTLGGPETVRMRRGPVVFLATLESPHKQIQVRRGLGYETVSTIMHEYGHGLGLEHLPTGLMNPDRSHSERVDPMVDTATLSAFEAAFQEISQ